MLDLFVYSRLNFKACASALGLRRTCRFVSRKVCRLILSKDGLFWLFGSARFNNCCNKLLVCCTRDFAKTLGFVCFLFVVWFCLLLLVCLLFWFFFFCCVLFVCLLACFCVLFCVGLVCFGLVWFGLVCCCCGGACVCVVLCFVVVFCWRVLFFVFFPSRFKRL
ncbi:hypothetical protein TETLON2b_000056 [Candidatus Hodgkinia cicadicola]|nr:hypothetical protein TETLON2b_000056 [Candidatus Hodgkinia cicadicola]